MLSVVYPSIILCYHIHDTNRCFITLAMVRLACCLEERNMARVCTVSGRGPMSGNARSHSLRATRRTWNLNLQKYKITENGITKTIKMSARAYRSLMKTQATR
jgi:large subunit ribosomal protein L28